MVFIAFFAGLLSFLSPCVLPLIPSYLSFITGVSVADLTRESIVSGVRFRIGLNALFFILGFSAVFMTMGASATAVGSFLLEHQRILQRLGGVLVLTFGAALTGILKVSFFSRERRFSLCGHPTGFAGSLVIGAVFAFGWSPCVGPILASILVLAGTRERLSEGLLLLSAYSLGLGVPFFLAALATGYFLSAMKALQKYLLVIERLSGGLLIAIGLLLLTGYFSHVAAALNQQFIPLVNVLTSWEGRMFHGNP